MSIETANALRAAKARIEDPEKWCKGELRIGDAYCAAGACGEIDGRMPTDDPCFALTKALTEHLPEEFRWRWGGLADYNDANSTTHADIMALFDRAIAAEEQTE